MAHELNIGTISGFGADELITQLVDLMVENKIGNVGKYDGSTWIYTLFWRMVAFFRQH